MNIWYKANGKFNQNVSLWLSILPSSSVFVVNMKNCWS